MDIVPDQAEIGYVFIFSLVFHSLDVKVAKELPIVDSSSVTFIGSAILSGLGNLSRQLSFNHLLKDIKGLRADDRDAVDEKGWRRTNTQVRRKFEI